MQKIGTLSLDGLMMAIYDAVESQNIVYRKRGTDVADQELRLAQAIGIKVEPLSKHASQWIRGKGQTSCFWECCAANMREIETVISLDGWGSELNGGPLAESEEAFLAEERREEGGKMEFLRLTVRIFAMAEAVADYSERIRGLTGVALEAARVYLQRDKSQCCSCL